MVTCTECNKTLRTESGLAWHLEHRHGAEVAEPESQVGGPHRVAVRDTEAAGKLEERLQKLERVTGLNKSTPPESLIEIVSDTELPLTDRLTNITEQVTKLSDTVSKLSQDVGLSKVTRDADRDDLNKRIEEVERKSEDDLNSLAAVVNIHRDAFNHDLAVLESRIGKVQKMVEDLGEGLNTVKTKLTTHGHDNLKCVPELVAKVGKIEQTLGSMQSQVDYLGRVAKRWPTGNMVQVALTDSKEHTFREYKSTRGLTKPYKSSTDLLFGGRWVDLSEPED